MKPADHPQSCSSCAGTGYTDGPDEYETVDGAPHRYSTVVPCRREWWNDPPPDIPWLRETEPDRWTITDHD